MRIVDDVIYCEFEPIELGGGNNWRYWFLYQGIKFNAFWQRRNDVPMCSPPHKIQTKDQHFTIKPNGKFALYDDKYQEDTEYDGQERKLLPELSVEFGVDAVGNDWFAEGICIEV